MTYTEVAQRMHTGEAQLWEAKYVDRARFEPDHAHVTLLAEIGRVDISYPVQIWLAFAMLSETLPSCAQDVK